MRRLQFRAWDIIAEKMDEVCELDNTADYDRIWHVKFEHGGKDQAWTPNVIIMQWTGLYDKNNKPIYEGDIVKPWPEHPAFVFKNEEGNRRLEYTAGQVMWQSSGWYVGQRCLGATEMSEFATCDCCPCGLEIIGNIYENKDLIGE